MKVGDIAHVWTDPSHVGSDFPAPRRVRLVSLSEWAGRRLWRAQFVDERCPGSLDFNEDCMQVVEEGSNEDG